MIPLVRAGEEKRLTGIAGFGPNLVLEGNKGSLRPGRGGQGGWKMQKMWKMPLLFGTRGWRTKEAARHLGLIRFNLYQTWNT